MPLAPDLEALGGGAQVGARLEQLDPLIESLVGLRLADEQDVKAVEERAAAEGLMGIEVVAQQRDGTGQIAGGVGLQPAFGGGDLTILFGVAILWRDEFGPQRDHLRLIRGHHHRGYGAVIVGDLARLMFEVRTLWAMNLLGGEIPGAVQGNQGGSMDGTKALEDFVFAERLVNAVIHRIERFRRDGVQHVPDLIVAGDGLDLEEALRVVVAPGGLHGLLMGQERRRLSEEHRKGPQAKVGHAIGGVVNDNYSSRQ